MSRENISRALKYAAIAKHPMGETTLLYDFYEYSINLIGPWASMNWTSLARYVPKFKLSRNIIRISTFP